MNLSSSRLVLFHLCFASFTAGILLQQSFHFLLFLVSMAALFRTGWVPGTLLGRGKRAAAALFAAIFLAALLAQWRFQGHAEFGFHWALLAFWLVTPALVDKANWVLLHRLMMGLSVPGLIYSFYWMLRPDEIAWAMEKGFHMFPRAEGFVSNPITNAATLILIGSWSFARLTSKVARFEKGLIWSHLSLSILIVVVSRVRGGIVGFLFLFVAVALFSEKMRKRSLWMAPLVILMFLGTWYFFGFNVASIQERLTLIANSWVLIKEYPLFGIGPDHFFSFVLDGGELLGHPHNTVIGITAETGFLGLVAYLSFMVAIGWALFRLYRAYRTDSGPMGWVTKSLILVYGSYWVIGLTDYNFADTELLLAHAFQFATAMILSLKIPETTAERGSDSGESVRD